MRAVRLGVLASMASVMVLAACGAEDPQLMNIRKTSRGPDEFVVVPGKPLEPPPDYASLPTPTLGGANITDADPFADAVAALGGRPSAISRDGRLPQSAIVSHTTRFGVTPGIRESLAAEDLAFRRSRDGRLLERIFNVNVYFRAYRDQALDQHRELERFRRLGVKTSAAPPASVTQ